MLFILDDVVIASRSPLEGEFAAAEIDNPGAAMSDHFLAWLRRVGFFECSHAKVTHRGLNGQASTIAAKCLSS